MKPEVEFSAVGDAAYLTLRGPRLNSFAREMHHALAKELDAVRAMEDIRFVVLRGANGVFSSGGDLEELRRGLPDDYVEDYARRMQGTIGAISGMDKIVISVIEGAAIGAAAALAMSADLILCADDATMRLSFVHVGYVPDAGATYLLPGIAGAVGRDILLTGRKIAPEEALARGLVSRVCPADGLDDALEQLLGELRLAPQHALMLTKRLINDRTRDDYLAAVRREGETQPIAGQQVTPEVVDRVLQRARNRNTPTLNSR